MQTRRDFLKLAGAAALGGLAACQKDAEQAPAAGPSLAATPSPRPDRTDTLLWVLVEVDGRTPPPRRDHTITGEGSRAVAHVFGGRSGGRSLNDLWTLDLESASWRASKARGPAPRFGHNAVLYKERLVIFGGQGGPGVFFNDVWAYDPESDRWEDVSPGGTAPSPRYGASGTIIGEALTISHGFTDAGRFDDTWSLGRSWHDVSPAEGPRPVERCLHRAAFVPAIDRMILFGGQTTGVSALDDTWLFDPEKRTWAEVGGRRPPARNLFADAATDDTFVVFGGTGLEGARNDTWAFRAGTWDQLPVTGRRPDERGATAGTVSGGSTFLVFGGMGSSGELDDLWMLDVSAAGT